MLRQGPVMKTSLVFSITFVVTNKTKKAKVISQEGTCQVHYLSDITPTIKPLLLTKIFYYSGLNDCYRGLSCNFMTTNIRLIISVSYQFQTLSDDRL